MTQQRAKTFAYYAVLTLTIAFAPGGFVLAFALVARRIRDRSKDRPTETQIAS